MPSNQKGKSHGPKVPTTVEDQSIGVKNGISRVQQTLKERYAWEGKFQFIHYSTTVATNAVFEGKGARTGLIITAGHKDILAVRRSQIPGGLGAWLHYMLPDPNVPLKHVIQCSEGMSVDGKMVVPVDVEALDGELKKAWVKERPEAVAILLLNLHVNSKHEDAVASVVRGVLDSGITVIHSSDVLHEVGEYKRTVTTCTSALIKPVVQTYLGNLQTLLAEDREVICILKSDSRLTSLDLAGQLPVNILMSSPAGGVQGVADIVTQNTPYKNLITFDMGRTSTDVALVYQGKPQLRCETVVGDLTVCSSAVDI
ncbi:Hydantoinase/oxoprolinase N-terminal region-domain-containing protein [Aspergillus foveolatus]|uniref:Hydantoinase/oxoprolinase N-terminal region-domain-containing protein n=1 Tax=Aspergillus foveolatus TaxID=210207 RepID=UPI003CCDBB59